MGTLVRDLSQLTPPRMRMRDASLLFFTFSAVSGHSFGWGWNSGSAYAFLQQNGPQTQLPLLEEQGGGGGEEQQGRQVHHHLQRGAGPRAAKRPPVLRLQQQRALDLNFRKPGGEGKILRKHRSRPVRPIVVDAVLRHV